MSFDYKGSHSNNGAGYNSGFTGSTRGLSDAPSTSYGSKGIAVNSGRRKRSNIVPIAIGIGILLIVCIIGIIVFLKIRGKDEPKNNTVVNSTDTVSGQEEVIGDIVEKDDESLLQNYSEDDALKEDNLMQQTHNENDYYYNQLDFDQQCAYIQLKNGLLDFQTKVDIPGLSVSQMNDVIKAVRYDNPEIFWPWGNITIYTQDDLSTYVDIIIPSKAKEEYRLVVEKSENIIAGMPSDLNEYKKIKYIYDWIVNNVEYGHGERDQDVRSTLIDGVSVCNGYAFTFKLLCKEAGITCATVSGYATSNEGHAWNLVYIGDTPYWVDVTWGDPLFLDASSVAMDSNYIYLCMSDEEIFKTHRLDNQLKDSEGKTWVYPRCISNKYNYYKLNGKYFEEFDAELLADYIANEMGERMACNVEMQFGSRQAYEAALAYLFDNRGIWDIVQRNKNVGGMIWHSANEDALYLQIRFELEG